MENVCRESLLLIILYYYLSQNFITIFFSSFDENIYLILDDDIFKPPKLTDEDFSPFGSKDGLFSGGTGLFDDDEVNIWLIYSFMELAKDMQLFGCKAGSCFESRQMHPWPPKDSRINFRSRMQT